MVSVFVCAVCTLSIAYLYVTRQSEVVEFVLSVNCRELSTLSNIFTNTNIIQSIGVDWGARGSVVG
jgi:hypothetical protein